MSELTTSVEQKTKKSTKTPIGYMIAMIAVVVAVLGLMLIFHMASNAADQKASELAKQRVHDLAVQMQAGEEVDVWDEEVIGAIEAESDKAEMFLTARNMTGIVGGIAAVLLILVLQTASNKKQAVPTEDEEQTVNQETQEV